MRRRMTKRGSKRLFKATTGRTRAINLSPVIMRGGYRL